MKEIDTIRGKKISEMMTVMTEITKIELTMPRKRFITESADSRVSVKRYMLVKNLVNKLLLHCIIKYGISFYC